MEDFPSGKMNKAQFKEGLQQLGQATGNNAGLVEYVIRLFLIYYNHLFYSSHLFAVCDKSGDGLLDFSEFLLGFALMGKGDLDSKLETAFRL